MSTAYSTILDEKTVTADNIEIAREGCRASDQARELQVGDETWGIIYEGGQRGQMSRYKESGRGAVAFGGNSIWGDWVPAVAPDGTEGTDMLATDDGHFFDECGEQLCKHGYSLRPDADRDCDCV